MTSLDPLKAFKKGFQGEAEYLKGRESLSDYQSKPQKEEIDEETLRLREALLKM